MKKLLLLGVAVLLASCAGFAQIASIEKAYEKYEAKKYRQTLTLITRAENVKEVTSELKAELTYLKAQAYEQLGELERATVLYQYLVEQHASTQYGYFASEKLAQTK